MKPYTAADLGPTDKPLVMRGLDLPQSTRLLDLREEEIRELERDLVEAESEGRIGALEYLLEKAPRVKVMVEVDPGSGEVEPRPAIRLKVIEEQMDKALEEAKAALASHPAPEPVKLPEGITLPVTVRFYLDPDAWAVVDSSAGEPPWNRPRVIAEFTDKKLADWICAVLNAAGGGAK